MRRLLSPAVTQAELIGIIAWLGVLLIHPDMQLDIYLSAITLCLLSLIHI
mgnify:CR=1 FL=1